MSELILASKSPRRRDLMKLLGHPFISIVSTVKENTIKGETPSQHVTRLSELKARDVGNKRENSIIIGADTIVILNDEILGKPDSSEQAVEMLMKLQDNTHTVFTGFTLYDTTTENLFSSYETSCVSMRKMTVELARLYVATGEPLDKAGAYGIQGYGAALINSINGCFFNVMGLPLARLMDALYTFSGGEFRYFGVC